MNDEVDQVAESLKREIPEGGVYVAHVAVVEYMDSKGELKFMLAHDSGSSISSILGLLQLGMLNIWEVSKDW